MKLLVCGGRDFVDRPALFAALDWFSRKHDITLVIHGGARGVDVLAGAWAKEEGIKVKAMPANWERDGKAAGPIRNAAMLLEKPDAVIAFPGGNGTADMVRKAKRAGVPVYSVPDCIPKEEYDHA